MRGLIAVRRTLVVVGAAVVVLIVMVALIRHFTGPRYLEQRLANELGGDYAVHIESSHYDLLRRSFRAASVTIVPDSLRRTPRDRGRRTQTFFRLPWVSATGVNLLALRRGDIHIEEIDFDRPEVRVFLDRNLVSAHPGAKRLPHEVLMASGRRVRIGKIRVANGDIQYAERPLYGDHAGMFHFANFDGTLTNLDVEACRAGKPCVIDVRTRLADSGPLHATFNYDLSSSTLKLDYHATMGLMDVVAMNKLLVNLKGIRIKEGTIDSLYADIDMRGDRATGTVRLPYHGLKFEMLDKNSHDRDLGDKFSTFLYSRKVHNSNPEDNNDPVTVVRVERRRLPQVSLIKFVWETVREGVFLTANVPEPPPAAAANAANTARQ